MGEYNPEDPKWDSDASLDAIKMERSVNGDQSDEDLTRKILAQAGPMAAQSIVHLAIHGTNENTRLNAAKYVTDNLINEGGAGGAIPSWEKLVGAAVSEAELHANQGN